MSIEMENPKTIIELVDAAHNLVHQMHIAQAIRDVKSFEKAFEKADKFLFEALQKLEESGIE